MAQHRSAEKRARQSLKRRARNRSVLSEVRGSKRSVEAELAGGNADAAAEKLRQAERLIRKAASKGVMKKATASRTVSRLAKAVHRAQQS